MPEDVKQRVLRELRIMPEDMSEWAKMTDALVKEVRGIHPDYPEMTGVQLMSYVKRLLPKIRKRINDKL